MSLRFSVMVRALGAFLHAVCISMPVGKTPGSMHFLPLIPDHLAFISFDATLL